MKARDIVGKTVSGVRQERLDLFDGRYYDLQEIYFTDGSSLMLISSDPDCHNVCEGMFKPGKARGES